MVGQVKPAISFDGVFEHADDVLIFVGQLQFALGLKLFEVVGIHPRPSVDCVRKARKSAANLFFALFANLGRLTSAITQEAQFRATHLTVLQHFDFFH